MKVTLIKDYDVAPDGHTTFKLKAGTEVEGTIAEMAIRDGKAKPAKELPKPKYSKPTAAKYKG
jgi:hypothetical protein